MDGWMTLRILRERDRGAELEPAFGEEPVG